MNRLLLIIVVGLVLFLNYSCVERCKWEFRPYLFELPFEWTPAKEVYKIGDTIHLKAAISDKFIDLESGKSYDIKDFTFFTDFTFEKIDEADGPNANPMFEVVLNKGAIKYTNLTADLSIFLAKFIYQDGTYYFDISFIPRNVGDYYFIIASSFPNDLVFDFDPKCELESPKFVYKINNGDAIENNYHLIQESPEPWAPDLSEEIFNDGGYAFRVIE